MAFLSAAELASMRADAEMVLGDSCTVRVPSETVDEYGSTVTSWSDTEGVPCKLAPLPVRDQSSQAGAGFTAIASWVLSIPFDQPIASGYRVVMAGKTYEVLRTDDDHTWRALRRAHLRRMDG